MYSLLDDDTCEKDSKILVVSDFILNDDVVAVELYCFLISFFYVLKFSMFQYSVFLVVNFCLDSSTKIKVARVKAVKAVKAAAAPRVRTPRGLLLTARASSRTPRMVRKFVGTG